MIDQLKACVDRRDLADLLEVTPSELSYVLYIMPKKDLYSPFCISKKNGNTRNILAPHSRLKYLQRQLLRVLYACEMDYQAHGGRPVSFGFKRGRGIIDNAARHKRCKFVLNIDIADYFDQFNFGRVRGFFIKDSRFQLKPAVATVIAQIACFDNKLPQGSPCSPHIADLCTQFFDQRMIRFLRPLRCRYSRYADDITISSNLKGFPSQVAIEDDTHPQGWIVSEELTDLFDRSGFSINADKVRMGLHHSRQMVTGLVVNDRPNITREYYLQTRAMCFRLFGGKPIELRPFTSPYENNCSPSHAVVMPDARMHIEGRMAFLDHVRNASDQRSLREQQDSPSQFFELLRKYFVYREFFGIQRPKILTEGPSDVYYISASAKALPQGSVPHLYDKGVFQAKFFKFGSRQSEVLNIGGGCGSLKRFLYLFKHYAGHFQPHVPQQPVVMVIDNDKAGRDVLSMVKEMYGLTIDTKSGNLWNKIQQNLYVVHTPLGLKKTSCIEDLLPTPVRKTVLNGKTFSSDPKFDPNKHFGKTALASYVSAHAKTIDFKGLAPLLSAINACIDDASHTST